MKPITHTHITKPNKAYEKRAHVVKLNIRNEIMKRAGVDLLRLFSNPDGPRALYELVRDGFIVRRATLSPCLFFVDFKFVKLGINGMPAIRAQDIRGTLPH